MADPQRSGRASASRVLRRVGLSVALVLGSAMFWSITWGTHLSEIGVIEDIADPAMNTLNGGAMIVDVILGIIALVILPRQRRAPLAVAIVIVALTSLSAFAGIAAIVAVVRAAMRVSRRGLVALGLVWILAFAVSGALVFPALGAESVLRAESSLASSLGSLALDLLIYLALVAFGRYRRARAETLTLLRQRADATEAERQREVDAAREAERRRIAREMHDVLAHRISLVAMHAGALTYREDLPREKVIETAHVIHDSAAAALRELREVLGVLREDDDSDALRPTPTLEHLSVLLAETRASGMRVVVQIIGMDASGEQPVTAGWDASLSRTAYRVVQESLTNARKHGTGALVHLRLAHEGERLVVTTRNPLRTTHGDSPASGLGLIGLTERAELAGGRVATQRTAEEFVLEAWLPWT